MKAIIISHLVLFESMFFIKNIILTKKLGTTIRGKNKEAVIAIILFIITIILALASLTFEKFNASLIVFPIFINPYFIVLGLLLLIFNILFSALALFHMRNSWRIGIKENDAAELITDGIFSYSRNPYFFSYILLFIAYSILIPNILVMVFSLLSVVSIHIMILREEKHLSKTYGEKYLNYKKAVPRYLLI